ncbi:MAG: crotonase/enoyl-CoA hydratase family protein [Acidobacteria bacterium]|nr:crotonase/enoyl-CoA hydratase family protein [Acidobacteriota bacterium]
MPERVSYTWNAGISVIALNDGKANIMSPAMLDRLSDALDVAERNGGPVVLRSAVPGVFSAGFDLSVFKSGDRAALQDMVRQGAELAARLLEFPYPVIGLLEGHAYPMGAFLLLASDLRIAARSPLRIGLNEVAIGIVPPAFAIELARSRLHPAWLNRTVVLGEMFGPNDACRAGFVDIVVSPEDLEHRAFIWTHSPRL